MPLAEVKVTQTPEPLWREVQPWLGKPTRSGSAPPATGRTPVAIRQTAAWQRPLFPGRSRLFAIKPGAYAPPSALCGQLSVLEALSGQATVLEALSGQLKVHLC